MTILSKTIGAAVVSVSLTSLCMGGEMNYSWKGYPSTAKTPSEAKLLVERRVPKSVRPNKEYTYELKITNRAHYRLDEITLVEKLPPGFQLVRVHPAPTAKNRTRRELKWDMGVMEPDQKLVISITGKATRPGKIVHRGNANLIFHLGQMNAIMEVVNPSIQFTVEAKKNIIVTETFPALMTFKNNGTATVLGAKLSHTLVGLRASGSKKLTAPIPPLHPGDSRTFRVNLQAVKTGKFVNNFVVKANDGVTASAKLLTVVTQPKLALTGSAPEIRYKGNKIHYVLKVTNNGDGEARDLRAVLDLSGGVKFLTATEGGKASGSKVEWDLGTLPPKAGKEFAATVEAAKIMKVAATATVKAFAAPPKSQSFLTDVQGIPALLLWVDDKTDPVAVGENVVYTINVRNQGSKAASGVSVECLLENSMQLVKVGGPTKGKRQGKKVVFELLRSLPVGETATWTVMVKALQEGDVRFGANVKCKQLPAVVTEYESTNFYKE